MRFGASTFIWVSPFSNRTLDLLPRVRGLGFDLIEICIEDPATIDPRAIRPALAESGLGVLACGVFGPDRHLSAEQPEARARALEYLRRAIDLTAAMGAELLAGPMYAAVGSTQMLEPAAREQQRAYAVDGLSRAAEYAAACGVRLALEPLNRFETDLVNTVEQAVELVERVGRPELGILLDTFHMNIEERDLPAAIRRAGQHVFHFHACASDRGTPGRDHLPWPGIVQALQDIRYDGPVVIEAFNPAIREIARAVSLWRPLAASEDALAGDGLAFLRTVFGA